jgi:hypothetical protein
VILLCEKRAVDKHTRKATEYMSLFIDIYIPRLNLSVKDMLLFTCPPGVFLIMVSPLTPIFLHQGYGGYALSTVGKGKRWKDPLTLSLSPRGEGKRVCPLTSILLHQ